MVELVLASSSPHRRELLARLGLPFHVQAPEVDEAPLPGETPKDLVVRLSEWKARAVTTRWPGAVIIGSDQVAVVPQAGEPVGEPLAEKEPSAGVREGEPLAEKDSAGAREGAPLAEKDSARAREGEPLAEKGSAGVRQGAPLANKDPSPLILGKPHNRSAAIEQLRNLSGRQVDFLTGLCVMDPAGKVWVEIERTQVLFRNLTGPEIVAYVERERPFGCAASFRSERLGIALVDAIRGTDPNALVGLPLIRLCRMLKQAGVNPLAQIGVQT